MRSVGPRGAPYGGKQGGDVVIKGGIPRGGGGTALAERAFDTIAFDDSNLFFILVESLAWVVVCSVLSIRL